MKKPFIYGTVCSGVEAFGPAWAALGWQCAFHAEIDPHASAVLRYHYPNVPNYGDFTTITADHLGGAALDLLAGGTPCQDFSLAGLRAGITGAKGNLTLEFIKLAARLRPRWLLWENVPGVLSDQGGRAFGAFLSGLAECGYGFAYRVLDAAGFGVAQARRRVFVVGCFGDWRPPAAVLFDAEGVSGVDEALPWDEYAATLYCGAGGKDGGIGGLEVDGGEIRRLTPLERERLMGYPKGWTRYGIDAAGLTYELADTPRHNLTGNGWATPVAAWIAGQIQNVESLIEQEADHV